MKTGPLRLIIVTGVTLFIAMRLMGWLEGESESPSKREGTSTLAGTVVDDTGKPLGGAHVFMTDDGAKLPRTASADAEGRFSLDKIPKGTYQLGASTEGHLAAYFVHAPPHWGVTPVAIADGAALSGFQIRVPRSAAIAGVVLSADGKPLADHEVRARAVGRASGQAIVSGTVGVARTDASGQYSIDHLDAGEYTIVARPRTQPNTVLFYPGALKLSGATTLVLARGERRAGIDLRQPSSPTTAIEGVVTFAGGSPPARVDVLLIDRDATLPFGEDRTVETDTNGRFVITRVPAGRFAVVAQTTLRPADAPGSRDAMQITRLSGTAAVEIDGRTRANVSVALAPGVPVSGRLTHPYRMSAPPTDESRLTIRLSGADTQSRARLGFGGPEARVAADGSFTLLFVPPGRFNFVVTDRIVESVTIDERDITPAPIEIAGRERRGVVIAVTERAAEIVGTVRDEKGATTPEGTVIVFPADARLWPASLGRVRATRPDSSGQFRFEHLPAGEHLVAAVRDASYGAWDDLQFLEQIRATATKIRLGEGDLKTLELSFLQTFNKTNVR